MGKPSRKEDILKLFFEEPTKHWHFSHIKKKVPIADNKVSRWLKFFMEKELITKKHPKNKMPYYISNYNNFEYQTLKKTYALKEIHTSGLLKHLISLKTAKTIIIFGSFTRWDWHKDSDIDIFIYGNDKNFKQSRYERILDKEIQVFPYKTKKHLKKLNSSFIKNILKGNIIKGDLDFLEIKCLET
jgi:predicted nucleotidyltransferase